MAKTEIDKSIAHVDTQNDPKTLFYKGLIYLAVADYSAKKDADFVQFDAEKTIDEALASFKAHVTKVEKGSKADKSDEIRIMIYGSRFNLFEQGLKYYNKNKYDSAQVIFEGCVKLYDVINEFDTVSAFNAGLCGELQEKWDVAEKYYSLCVKAGYNGADMIVRYSNILMEINKDEEAIKVIQQGRAKYPKDNGLVIQEFNYYLKKGDNESAEKALNTAIKNNPRDPILYFNAGAIYGDLKKFDQAEQAYKKAIELDPKYFDAYFNLGAMYYNQGADLYNLINDIKDNAIYEKEKQRAADFFKQALPFLEKARELKPKDRDNLIMLRTIYGRLGMNDKYKEVNEALKN
jgi:tetratricopeptide (TPR) repeat protein